MINLDIVIRLIAYEDDSHELLSWYTNFYATILNNKHNYLKSNQLSYSGCVIDPEIGIIGITYKR